MTPEHRTVVDQLMLIFHCLGNASMSERQAAKMLEKVVDSIGETIRNAFDKLNPRDTKPATLTLTELEEIESVISDCESLLRDPLFEMLRVIVAGRRKIYKRTQIKIERHGDLAREILELLPHYRKESAIRVAVNDLTVTGARDELCYLASTLSNSDATGDSSVDSVGAEGSLARKYQLRIDKIKAGFSESVYFATEAAYNGGYVIAVYHYRVSLFNISDRIVNFEQARCTKLASRKAAKFYTAVLDQDLKNLEFMQYVLQLWSKCVSDESACERIAECLDWIGDLLQRYEVISERLDAFSYLRTASALAHAVESWRSIADDEMNQEQRIAATQVYRWLSEVNESLPDTGEEQERLGSRCCKLIEELRDNYLAP